jgi:hypothetical protein
MGADTIGHVYGGRRLAGGKPGCGCIALAAALVLVLVVAEPDDAPQHVWLFASHPPHQLDHCLGIASTHRRRDRIEVCLDRPLHRLHSLICPRASSANAPVSSVRSPTRSAGIA